MAKDIKIGCVAWGLPGAGYFAPYVAHLAGLDGIQLELGSYEGGYPLSQREVIDAYLEAKEQYKIEYPAIVLNDVMEHEFIHGRNTENGKIAYEQMELAVETAAQLHIEKIMIPNFIKNLITKPEHVENTAEALKFACEKAGKKGIDILTENALDAGKQIELLEMVGCQNLKIHFDTQNFKYNFNMDQCKVLESLYPYMDAQMHVKDGISEPGECFLGEGNTDFFPQMKILKDRGYKGWIVIENYYNLLPLRRHSANNNQMELLKKDIETLKACFA